MINSLSSDTTAEHGITDENRTDANGQQQLALSEFNQWLEEVQNQPAWRGNADKEMDYVDGNQLDSELLQKQKRAGIPPAIEPLIGPAIDSVLGFEAKTRKDFRVTADSDGPEGDDVAKALNYELNQAERHSGADAACGEAFKPQLCVGLGWVEVAKESDPFLFKYRCRAIHRNEIFWDMLAKDKLLRDARYLIRRKWVDIDQAALSYPDKADLIRRVGSTPSWAERYELANDGGSSTSLNNAWQAERGWSIEEQEWRDCTMRRVCIFEVWYRRWMPVIVLKAPDGRVVEYDPNNAAHVIAIARGLIKPERKIVARMFVSFWMGPHKLSDAPSPHPHSNFPYVPFWGKKEDRTGVPFGVVRGMIFLQDAVNSAISKIRWGLSAVRTIRTKGAYAGTDTQFRQMSARYDADFVLNLEEMAKPGAKFEIERDFQLSEQQYKMLQDYRLGIERASGLTASFQGQRGTATSGVQENTQVEQTTQSLADLMENFEESRMQVGELLVAHIINDMGDKPQTVRIRGQAPIQDKTVMLNQPTQDPATGMTYLTNDVLRTRLKVALSEVPATSSFRAQQLAAMSEAFKAMPQSVQIVVLPHLLSLMDVPNKDEVIKAIVDSQQQLTEEQVQQRIDQALKDAGYTLKARELELKYSPDKMAKELEMLDAQIGNLDAKSRQTIAAMVKAYIDAQFAAVQSAEVLTAVPQTSPVADAIIANAGGLPNHQPVVPVAGTGAQIVKPVGNPKTGIGFTPGAAGGPAPGDTSPQTPANPASPFVGAGRGIETMRADSGPVQGA